MAAAAVLEGPSASAETYHNAHGSMPESATPAAVADTTIFDTLDEVVVTGSNNAVSRNLLPYTVSTVSSSKIAASGQTKLLTAISGQVPGLFISQRSNFGFGISTGGSGGIKIRGVGGSPTNAVLTTPTMWRTSTRRNMSSASKCCAVRHPSSTAPTPWAGSST